MIAHSSRILYLHPSKTGGSSVEQAIFREETGGEQMSQCHRQVYMVYGNGGIQHWPYRRIVTYFPFLKDWKSFATVRNPYDRVISEWKYQQGGGCKFKGKYHESDDINGAIISREIKSSMYSYHWMPQVNYIGPNTRVIDLNNLEDEWSSLGFRLPIGHKNKSKSTKKYELSDQAKEIIQMDFAEDFEKLGYDI